MLIKDVKTFCTFLEDVMMTFYIYFTFIPYRDTEADRLFGHHKSKIRNFFSKLEIQMAVNTLLIVLLYFGTHCVGLKYV